MRAEFSILSVHEPGCEGVPFGVALLVQDRLFLRCRHPADVLADPSDAEILSAVIEDLQDQASRLSGNEILEYLEDTLSHWLRITDRQKIETDNPAGELKQLYALYVAPQTSVPKLIDGGAG